MPLQEQVISVALNAGMDTKTDPKQVSGKLLLLKNSIFQSPKQIKKRNGSIALPSLGKGVGISTYNNELISLDGTNLYSYDANGSSQKSKGACPTITLNTTSVVRNANQQTNQDSAINGTLSCFVWTDSSGGCRYSVFDTLTGQSIVNNAVMSATASYAKVLAIGQYFVILYYDSGATQLLYKSVAISTPTTITGSVTITSDMNSSNVAWDAEVINNEIFLAYNNSSAKISLYSLSSTLTLSTQTNFGSSNADQIAIFGDASFNVWVAYAVTGGSGQNTTVDVFALSNNLGSTVLAKTQIDAFQISSVGPAINTLTGIVTGTTATVYYEVAQAAIVTGIPLNFIKQNTVTTSAVVGTPSNFLLEVGLASKAFSFNGSYFILVAYQSNLQSSYFLMRGDGNIVGKLAPSNGGGLAIKPILPEVNVVSSGVFQIASLIKDSTIVQNGVITAQTGVQSATFTFSALAPSKFVLGSTLNVCGAIVKQYDGGSVVEQGFNLYPEGLSTSFTDSGGAMGPGASTASLNQFQYCGTYSWVDNQGQINESAPSVPVTMKINPTTAPIIFTGDVELGSNEIQNVSDTIGLFPGMYLGIMDPQSPANNFPTGATIDAISGTTIYMNLSCTGSGTITGASLVAMTTNFALLGSLGNAPNSTTITLFNGVGPTLTPQVGGVIFGIGQNGAALAVGTTITSINSGMYGISQPLLGEQGGNFTPPSTHTQVPWYVTCDGGSATISVPTLKLTQKQNVSINIYRTALNGTLFYLVTDPTSPLYNDPTVNSVTFTDTTADSILIGNAELYTNGGELENLGPPALDFSFLYKSRSVAVQSENRLAFIYSKQVLPGTPVEYNSLEFVENVDSRIGSITAGFQMDDKMILWGPASKYWIVGDGPTAAGTNDDFSEATRIAGSTGCTNPASVVEIPAGLMYQDPTKGIWLLDRSLNEQYIGADVEAYNGYQVTSAQLVENVTQVKFTLSNGVAIVYDYIAGQWSEFDNCMANDSCIFQGLFTFINQSGVIWQEQIGTFTDADGSAILIGGTSAWIQLAQVQGFQRIWQLLFLGTYYSPHSLTITIYTDFSSTPSQTTIGAIPNASPPQFRVFMKEQKCEALQIVFQESQSTPYGEGLALSNISMMAGIKRGAYKIQASESYG